MPADTLESLWATALYSVILMLPFKKRAFTYAVPGIWLKKASPTGAVCRFQKVIGTCFLF